MGEIFALLHVASNISSLRASPLSTHSIPAPTVAYTFRWWSSIFTSNAMLAPSHSQDFVDFLQTYLPHKSCPWRWEIKAQGSGSSLQHSSNSPASWGALGWALRNSATRRWDLSLLGGENQQLCPIQSLLLLASVKCLLRETSRPSQGFWCALAFAELKGWLQLYTLHFKAGVEPHGFGT